MESLTLKAMRHRDKDCIGIYFSSRASFGPCIKKIEGIRWSQTNKCWYLPLTKNNYNNIIAAAGPSVVIEDSQLKDLPELKSKAAVGIKGITVVPAVARSYERPGIHPINAHVLPALDQMLQLKAYSNATIKTYSNEMSQLLVILKNKPADELTTNDIKRYLVYCYEKLRLSENTLHSRINALKFYYEQVLQKEKIFWEIPRPKKRQQNPHFFNQDEIAQLLKQTTNIKHKTMLMLAYSTGMRVSEVTRLKVWQIDSKRMQILVEQAKGKKDRVTALSPVLLVMLREYFRAYRPKKDGYLFCGQEAGTPYSSRSLQAILQQAKKKAGIMKPGSIHALRHSFATHLLDKGTDVTMIMKLLGHNDLKTTLRYLHVTNRDVLQIVSPLDHLNLD